MGNETQTVDSKVTGKENITSKPKAMTALEKLKMLKAKSAVATEFTFRLIDTETITTTDETGEETSYDRHNVEFVTPIPTVRTSHAAYPNLVLNNVTKATIREELLLKLLETEGTTENLEEGTISYNGTEFRLDIPKPTTRWNKATRKQEVVPFRCVITDLSLANISRNRRVEGLTNYREQGENLIAEAMQELNSPKQEN